MPTTCTISWSRMKVAPCCRDRKKLKAKRRRDAAAASALGSFFLDRAGSRREAEESERAVAGDARQADSRTHAPREAHGDGQPHAHATARNMARETLEYFAGLEAFGGGKTFTGVAHADQHFAFIGADFQSNGARFRRVGQRVVEQMSQNACNRVRVAPGKRDIRRRNDELQSARLRERSAFGDLCARNFGNVGAFGRSVRARCILW